MVVSKVYSILTILILSILLITISFISCIAEVIPGGSFDSAGVIELNPQEPYRLKNEISQLEDHYYRLKGIDLGYELMLKIDIMSEKGGTIIVSLFTENRAKIWDHRDILRDGELKNVTINWLSSIKQDFYLKISSAGGSYVYNLTASLIDKRDYETSDAGSNVNTALYIGILSYGRSMSFDGYLSKRGLGDDFLDYYSFDTSLNKTQYIVVTIKPSDDTILSASIQLPDGFSLVRNSSALPGKPFTLTLKGDIAGNKTFYLVVSNNDGYGGGGRYSVEMKVFNIVKAIEIPEVNVSKIDREYARLLIITSVAVILAMSVVAAILIRRRERYEYYYEYGYW